MTQVVFVKLGTGTVKSAFPKTNIYNKGVHQNKFIKTDHEYIGVQLN